MMVTEYYRAHRLTPGTLIKVSQGRGDRNTANFDGERKTQLCGRFVVSF
jgi:hypothetical protein